MNTILATFIRDKQINSFPKLRFLLFLCQHPQLAGCPQQWAERLYIEPPLAEKLIADLQKVGLLEGKNNGYALCDEPDLKAHLRDLVKLFENPLDRQELLDRVIRNLF